ncbi:MAG: SbcC/MukB-like Walker B domain-containing protein [Bdellovibrionota bacterium]|nr:SbcC/MukB-like Walker B domain-containing protein [Bdellovibrionota bacterium]
MRIHNLSITNIASLKGRHHVDFNKVAHTSNLFAITGPTGSGKSTLLNCVSLALYGEVYKKNSTSADFITMGESFGEIELDFSHGQTHYLAHWKLKIRKKNGEYYKKPQLCRTLFQLHKQEKIALEKTAEDVLHLSFSQFCKTSILNQGEFAKFLKSSFIERKEILEKFYEGEDLTTLNSKLREKINSLVYEKQTFKNQVIGINDSMSDRDISEDQIDTQKKEVQRISDSYALIENLKLETDDFSLYLENLNRFKKNLDLIKAEMTTVHEELNAKSQNQAKSLTELNKASEALNTNRDLLKEASQKFERSLYLKQSLEKLQAQQSDIEEQIKIKTEQQNKLEIQKQSLEDNISELKKCSKFVEMFSVEELSEKEYLLRENFLKLEQNNKRLDSLIKQKNEFLQETKQIETKLDESAEKWANFSLEKVDKEREALNQNRAKIDSLGVLLAQRLKTVQKQDLNLKTLKEKKETLEKDLKDLNEKERVLENELKHQHQNIENHQRVITLNKLIEETNKKGHCVLCEQETPHLHPLTGDNIHLDELLSKKEQLELDLKNLTQKLGELKVNLIGFQREHQRLIEETQNDNSSTLQQWNALEFLPLLQDKIKNEHLEVLRSKRRDFDKLIEQLDSKKNLHQLNLAETQNLKQMLQKLISNSDQVDREIKSLSQENENVLKLIKRITSEFDLPPEISCLVELKKIISWAQSLSRSLRELENLEVNIKATSEALKDLNKNQSKRRQDHNIYREENGLIDNFMKSNKIDYNPAQRLEELEINQQSRSQAYNIANESLKKQQIKYAEIKSRFESLEDNIEMTEKKCFEIQAAIQTKAKSLIKNGHSGHANILPLCEKLAQIEVQSPLELIQESFTLLKDFVIEFKKDLQNQKSVLTEYEVIFKQKIENLKRITQLEEQIKNLTAKENRLEALNILIGKDEFRNYVLSQIEALLIEQTNRELHKLCEGRYKLTQTHKRNRQLSEFMIVDHYHSAQARKVSTLSGGETFLVSLALALALAEMTRGQTQVDSLFIDEGFGTLDLDAIDDVLELLIEMQNSGKQIGLISHVQKLTQRIPVNINLIKSNSGLSDIEIVMN